MSADYDFDTPLTEELARIERWLKVANPPTSDFAYKSAEVIGRIVGDPERAAWELLPDDVREHLTRRFHAAQLGPGPLLDYARRMTPPSWEPTDRDIEITAKALAGGSRVVDSDRDEARRILTAQHDAGLIREDDR